MLKEDFPEHGIDTFLDPAAIRPGPLAPKDALLSGQQPIKKIESGSQNKNTKTIDKKSDFASWINNKRLEKASDHGNTKQNTIVNTGFDMRNQNDLVVEQNAKQIISNLIDLCANNISYNKFKTDKTIELARKFLQGG